VLKDDAVAKVDGLALGVNPQAWYHTKPRRLARVAVDADFAAVAIFRALA
jgi:hypothetical protein